MPAAKCSGVGAALPDHSLQRQLDGTPAYDYTADLRLMFTQDAGSFRLLAHHTTVLNGGDSFAFLTSPGATLDQQPSDDDLRLMDLTWELTSGDDYRLYHRFDRWRCNIGRQPGALRLAGRR